MPAPTTTTDIADLLRKSRLLTPEQLDAALADPAAADAPSVLVRRLQDDGLLTPFQAEQLLRGRHRGFVLGKYRLLARLGAGQVYLAEHTAMRRRAVLKVLPPDQANDPVARERFLREARAFATLEHPNLVRAFDAHSEGNITYLVTEYVDGTDLADLVARRGPLPPDRVAHYVWQAANGLQALHDRGLVHRDIHPGNLLLDRAGAVKILDLGLVRSQADGDELTRQGAVVLGNADFLSPEQAADSSLVDGRADLYALGATAYLLLTGRPPFPDGRLADKLAARHTREPAALHTVRPGIPIPLAAVVHRLLAKNPGERYPSAGDLAAALAAWARPLPPPPADDFPPPPVGLAVRGGSATPPPGAAPDSVSASTVRIAPDLAPPGQGGSQGSQTTAATRAEDTAVSVPVPAAAPTAVAPVVPLGKPKPVMLGELSSRVVKPTGRRTGVRTGVGSRPALPGLPAHVPSPGRPSPHIPRPVPFDPEPDPADVARAAALFAEPEPEPAAPPPPATWKKPLALGLVAGGLMASAALAVLKFVVLGK